MIHSILLMLDLDLVVPDILKEKFDSTNNVALLIGKTYQLECTWELFKVNLKSKKDGYICLNFKK